MPRVLPIQAAILANVERSANSYAAPQHELEIIS